MRSYQGTGAKDVSASLCQGLFAPTPLHVRINVAQLLARKTVIPIDHPQNLKTERLIAAIVELGVRRMQCERDKVTTRQEQTGWNQCRDVMHAGRLDRDSGVRHRDGRIEDLFAFEVEHGKANLKTGNCPTHRERTFYQDRHVRIKRDRRPSVRIVQAGRLESRVGACRLEIYHRFLHFGCAQISRNNVFGRTRFFDLSVTEQDATRAKVADRVNVVAYENDGTPFFRRDVFHLSHTLFLKLGVADSKDFIDQQNFRIEMGRDGKGEPHVHAARVSFHRRIEKLLDLGEGDNVVEFSADFGPGHAENCTV